VTTTVTRRSRGSIWFLAGSVAVHAGNYAFNVVVAHRLSPAEYSDVALAVSGLLLAGFVTVGLQIATARMVATGDVDPSHAASLARWFSRVGFRAGVVVGVIGIALLPVLNRAFDTGSSAPLLGVMVALPFALATGVGRGWLQGSDRFGRLALSFQAEMVVRLGLGAGAVLLGHGVAGAVGGLVASVMVAAALSLPPAGSTAALDPVRRRTLVMTVGPSLMLLAGEALINHVDTIVAKAVFDPATAGQFAAIALLGRSVFFVTWPVSMLAFPAVASAAAVGGPVDRITRLAAGIVAAIGVAAVAVGFAAPDLIVGLALGGEYVGLSHLLGPYLAATGLFAVTSTLLSLRLAGGDERAGAVAVGGGVAVTLALGVFHPSPEAVVWLQVGIMAAFLCVVCAWPRLRRGATP
jgi:O-antigen/teichoic acid export membrane protein